jgi:predicted nuclease of predicted toxin-antitoxin system
MKFCGNTPPSNMKTFAQQLPMEQSWPVSGWSISMRSENLRFKVDENLPEVAAKVLREAGFDAETVLSEGLGGAPDSSVALVCKKENRALITLDLDFSDIRTYPPKEYPGIIVLRPHNHSIPNISVIMQKVIALLQKEPLKGAIWSVDDRRVRIYGN